MTQITHRPAFGSSSSPSLVIDLAATTDENNRCVPRDQLEINEDGAVLADATASALRGGDELAAAGALHAKGFLSPSGRGRD